MEKKGQENIRQEEREKKFKHKKEYVARRDVKMNTPPSTLTQ